MNLRVTGSLWIFFYLATSAWAQTDVGSIRATLEPVEVVAVGPTWQAGGSGPKLSGDILDSLPPGSYTVSFSSVIGWTKPADQLVVVVGRRITEVTGRYIAQVALPVIDRHPASASVVLGAPWQISVQVTGAGLIYTWYRNGIVVSQTTTNSFGASVARDQDAGTYFVRVENSAGFVDSRTAIVTVTAPQSEPVFSVQPGSQNATAGNSASFQATAIGNPAPQLKWQRLLSGTSIWQDISDGGQFSGSATTQLSIGVITASMSGDKYRVMATNSVGTVVSAVATLTVAAVTVTGSRLVNISILTALASSSDTFTLGYVVGNSSSTNPKPLVIRSAGPSLGALGVAGTISDPRFELFAGATKTGENDNWGGSASLSNAFVSVGAFPYASATSLDAATLANITSRDNSVKVSGTGGGTVIAEVYDATPSDSFTANSPRLINVSVLKTLGTGFTIGFVLRGSGPKTVLVRAIGPTLGAAPFGIPGVVADPQFTLFGAGAVKLGENNDWGGAAALSAAFSAVGAFALPAGSRDAAYLATLQPGSYTVQVSGVGSTTGVALVEVYEVP